MTHIGSALSEEAEAQARAEAASNPRYCWLGELPRWKALRLLARSRLLVLTSHMGRRRERAFRSNCGLGTHPLLQDFQFHRCSGSKLRGLFSSRGPDPARGTSSSRGDRPGFLPQASGWLPKVTTVGRTCPGNAKLARAAGGSGVIACLNWKLPACARMSVPADCFISAARGLESSRPSRTRGS